MALTASQTTPSLVQAASPAPGSCVPAPHFTTAPRLTLEICRGRTRYPQRPVSGPRFFIGSGEACDLRLGGDVLPTIHSFIQTRGNGLWLEAVAAEPALLINGQRTRGEWLRDGDLLDIGPFQLVAHLIAVRGQLSQRVSAVPTPLAENRVEIPLEAAEPDLSSLSASELVDLIEEQHAMVEEFEDGRRAGAEALLETIRTRQRAQAKKPRTAAADVAESRPASRRRLPPAAPREMPAPAVQKPSQPALAQPRSPETFSLGDLEQICRQLNALSQQLERRSLQVDQREATYAAAALTLMKAQQHLKSQIEAVAEQIAMLEQRAHEQTPPPSRAIA